MFRTCTRETKDPQGPYYILHVWCQPLSGMPVTFLQGPKPQHRRPTSMPFDTMTKTLTSSSDVQMRIVSANLLSALAP